MRYLLLIIVSIISLVGQSIDQQVRFQQVFDNILLPAASVPVPNIGQGSHTVAIFYPTAVANVLGLQIRIEASFDNTVGSYFPISEDVTQANFNGTFSYAIAKANGTFPFVRIAALAVDPVLPADIWYTGSTFPIGAIVYEAPTTRYITVDTSGSIGGVAVSQTAPLTGQMIYYDINTGTYNFTPNPTINGQYYSWDTVTNRWILTAAPGGGVGGAGVAGQSAFWTAANTLSGDSNYTWANVGKELHIGPIAGWPAQGVGFTWDGNLVTHNDNLGVPNFPGIVMVSAGNAYSTAMEMLHSRGTLAAPTVVVSGDPTMTFSYFNYDGSQFVLSAQIQSGANGIISDINNHVGGYISLIVADGTSLAGPTDHLLIHGRHVTVGGIGQNDAILDLHTSALATLTPWPNPVAGSTSWCNNCNQANPCTAGGAGALAIYTGAQWNCQH